MNKQALERLVVCRIALLMKFPFWGNLATRLQLTESIEDWCKTAATDGRNLFYNSGFIMGLTDAQIIFVIGHEILHVVLDHLGRGQYDDPDISNIAADFADNAILMEEKIGTHIGTFISRNDIINPSMPKQTSIGTLYDPCYKGKSYEEIYDDLIKFSVTIKQNGGSGLGLDQHTTAIGGTDATPMTESELQAIKDSIREAVLSAAQTVGIGNVPAGIRRMIGDLVAPVMNWQQIITQLIESQVKADYTYMKLGRRSFSSDFIFPSMARAFKIRLTLGLDMSGSIGKKEIIEYFSEILGILDQYASFELGILCFDTGVYNYQVFTEDTRDELLEYEPVGGGGTDFRCIFDFLKENDILPNQLGIFTDGETSEWGDPDYCDTFFLIKNSKNIIAPFGLTVKYTR